MDWIYYFSLVCLLLIGLFLNILGLPGLWLMVAAFGAYAWATGWEVYVGWPSLLALIVLAGLAELAEFIAGAAGSKAAGGRRRGMIGAIVGGLIGGLFLTGLIPIPILGTIIGACLGAFLGAAIMEYSDRDATHALRVGVGAAKGRLYGIVSKLAFGVAMLVIALVVAFPIGANRITLPAPATTLPATSN